MHDLVGWLFIVFLGWTTMSCFQQDRNLLGILSGYIMYCVAVQLFG